MRKITYQDYELAYREYGSPENPVIIFLHGNSAGSAVFEAQFKEIFSSYYLLAPDFIGHGASGSSQDFFNYSLQGMAESIKALIDDLNLNNVIVYGVSLGGHVTIELAALCDKVKGIMISGSPPIPIPFDMTKYFKVDDKLELAFKPDASKIIGLEWGGACIHDNNTLVEFLADLFINTSSEFRINFGRTVAELVGTNDEKEIIEQTNIPVAIIEGQFEDRINNQYMRTLNIKNLYKNEVIQIGNSLHYPNMENPEAFNKNLVGFADYCFNS